MSYRLTGGCLRRVEVFKSTLGTHQPGTVSHKGKTHLERCSSGKKVLGVLVRGLSDCDELVDVWVELSPRRWAMV